MVKLSIVIPVYNVEKYISECIESIIKQLTPETELLLIDDGSTDRSGKICDRYTLQYPERIRVIHQVNSGVSVARNNGIEKARGEWITFVDGDDLLTDDAVKIMLDHACDKNVDLVVFMHAQYRDNKIVVLPEMQWPEMHLKSESELKEYRQRAISKIYSPKSPLYNVKTVYTWAKLYRKDFLTDHDCYFIPGIKVAEDYLFSITLAKYLKEVHLVPETVYLYRFNESSVSIRFSADILTVLTKLYDECNRAISEYDDRDAMIAYENNCLYHIKDAFRLGAYNKSCKWKRKERIFWLKEMRGKAWVEHAENVLSTEPNKKWRNLIERLIDCHTETDFALADSVFYWSFHMKPMLKENRIGKRLKNLLKRNHKK